MLERLKRHEKSNRLHWSRKRLEPRRLCCGEAGLPADMVRQVGVFSLGQRPCPPQPGPQALSRDQLLPSLLSSFALATCCHFTHRNKGSRPSSHHPRTWGEAGDGGAGARGELELCPNKYWNQRLALLSPELKWSPRDATFFHVSWGWCHLPAVRETSESVLIPPSLSLSFSTSKSCPPGSRAIAECDGCPARPRFRTIVCLLEAGLVPGPWRPGSWGHQLSRTHSGRDPSTVLQLLRIKSYQKYCKLFKL